MTFPEFLDSDFSPKVIPKGGRVKSEKRHREFNEFTDLEITDVKTHVHELKKTYAGRQALRAVGRKDSRAFPFVAWDGEGITDEYGDHHYVLFGASDGTEITSAHLTTEACLEALIDSEENDPDVIHCAFAFNYDVEKILGDVDEKIMRRLVTANTAWWKNYRLEWFPRKWFQVTTTRNGKKYTAKVWDLFGFFQTSFVKALRTFFPGAEYAKDFDDIESGKQKRNQFQYEEVDSLIRPYWLSELKWMVKIADYLRELLHRAEMDISMWHGPGAIASYLFRVNGTERNMNQDVPKDVDNASRHAFAGGRFEQFVVGRANQPVYVYDINSAHPTGMSKLPSLAGNEWVPVSRVGEISDFGVYHVEFNADPRVHNLLEPMPFFHRSERGLVSYPMNVTGYYWQPEMLTAMMHGFSFQVLEGWELVHDGTRPFSWIQQMYDKRKAWQTQTPPEPAQIALKLGLNSLFGKTAQRVGWNKETRKPPKWHQLEWAGAITSNTRALLFDAMMQASEKDALLSVETDSVFSLEPLELDIGAGLGQWDYNLYEDMISIQNGIYWLKKDGEWKKSKIRGLDAESLGVDYVLGHLSSLDMRQRFDNPRDVEKAFMLHGETTRFITYKQAAMRDLGLRGNWETAPRDVQVGTTGKRVHNPDYCYACNEMPYDSPGERFHDLIHAQSYGGHSCPHNIPWLETEGAAQWDDPAEPIEILLTD